MTTVSPAAQLHALIDSLSWIGRLSGSLRTANGPTLSATPSYEGASVYELSIPVSMEDGRYTIASIQAVHEVLQGIYRAIRIFAPDAIGGLWKDMACGQSGISIPSFGCTVHLRNDAVVIAMPGHSYQSLRGWRADQDEEALKLRDADATRSTLLSLMATIESGRSVVDGKVVLNDIAEAAMAAIVNMTVHPTDE